MESAETTTQQSTIDTNANTNANTNKETDGEIVAWVDRLSCQCFFPSKNQTPIPPQQKFVIKCADDVTLECFYFQHAHPNPHRKTVVHFHGNGERVSHYCFGFDEPPQFEDEPPNVVQVLRNMDVNVLLVEYRGYGDSTGKPSVVSIMHDCAAVFDTLKLQQDQLIVYGRSIGSIFAIHFASLYPDIAGVVVDSGIADPFAWMSKRLRDDEKLEVDHDQLSKAVDSVFGHERKLRNFKGNFMTVHTNDDQVIPVESAHAMYEWTAAAKNREKVIFEFGGHNYIWSLNHTVYTTRLSDFLAICGHAALPPPPSSSGGGLLRTLKKLFKK